MIAETRTQPDDEFATPVLTNIAKLPRLFTAEADRGFIITAAERGPVAAQAGVTESIVI